MSFDFDRCLKVDGGKAKYHKQTVTVISGLFTRTNGKRDFVVVRDEQGDTFAITCDCLSNLPASPPAEQPSVKWVARHENGALTEAHSTVEKAKLEAISFGWTSFTLHPLYFGCLDPVTLILAHGITIENYDGRLRVVRNISGGCWRFLYPDGTWQVVSHACAYFPATLDGYLSALKAATDAVRKGEKP